jgi:hypothetical protein
VYYVLRYSFDGSSTRRIFGMAFNDRKRSWRLIK